MIPGGGYGDGSGYGYGSGYGSGGGVGVGDGSGDGVSPPAGIMLCHDTTDLIAVLINQQTEMRT